MVVNSKQPAVLPKCWLCSGAGVVDPERVCTCGMPANEMQLQGKTFTFSCGGVNCCK